VWTQVIRPYWVARREPCRRCGRAIDYTGGRFIPGTRRVNPRSLVVGHIVGRDEARRLGWSNAQINALSNTQPECADCSNKSGAIYGNRLRSARLRSVPVEQRPALDQSREW
jgi:hypothetical protein